MKRIALLVAGLVASTPAVAQTGGRVTLVVAPLTQRLEGLDSATLAQQVIQMLNNGAMSGTRIPLVLDGRMHEQRIRLGGDPAVFVDRRLSVTRVQAVQRDIVISYGPARRGGLGVHAEIVDAEITPELDGSVRRDNGARTEITGVVPQNGQPQALMRSYQAEPGSIVLPDSLIVLVEP